MSKLSRIFSIYVEAPIAAFMFIFALVELVCFITTPDHSLSYIFLAAAIAFTAAAIHNVRFIVRREHKRAR